MIKLLKYHRKYTYSGYLDCMFCSLNLECIKRIVIYYLYHKHILSNMDMNLFPTMLKNYHKICKHLDYLDHKFCNFTIIHREYKEIYYFYHKHTRSNKDMCLFLITLLKGHMQCKHLHYSDHMFNSLMLVCIKCTTMDYFYHKRIQSSKDMCL